MRSVTLNPQMKKHKRMEEKEMEKVKEICIGDSKGNNSHRDWCSDLPMDVLLLIMSKVGVIYILMGAQLVCKNWRKVCREVPSLWRNIDMTSRLHRYDIGLKRKAREAIDRAQGNVQQFDIGRYGVGDGALLQYLAHSTSLLRRLRLIAAFGITEEGFTKSIIRFPLLEELDITFGNYDKEVCELVGKACPHLKCFRYNQIDYMRYPHYGSDDGDDEALGIANYMPNLSHLQIVGNKISNAGLMAILDKCVHIESLDIRYCFNINMDASLRAKCARIKDLRLPNDPIDDYELQPAFIYSFL